MRLPIYQVDAFTKTRFAGNPAAIIPLTEWLPSEVMQQIAAENNLAETAFVVPMPSQDGASVWHLRWFTPAIEVPLCGHATLATAHVLIRHLGIEAEKLIFHTLSGGLSVSVEEDGRLSMNFPADVPHAISTPDGLAEALGASPIAVYQSKNYTMVELTDETAIRQLSPHMPALAQLGKMGVIVTARGSDADFVSRMFAPQSGIDEDPVTGSAHCVSVPFWAEKLGQTSLFARQISPRGGELWCQLSGDRVHMAGYAVTYLQGEIEL